MWELARLVVLGLAILTTGLQAGLYYGFSCGVMPGLGRCEDRTFVTAMQRINTAIVNPWFIATFFGAPLTSALAVGLHLGDSWTALVWVILGFVLAAATVLITILVNVPLNNALDAAGTPGSERDLASARTAFEAGWVRWNTIRTLTSIGSLLALAVALVLSGSTSG